MPGLRVDAHADLLGAATATFSADRVYRYALNRLWEPGGKVTVFVMLNPSTADAFADDPTIRRCVGFARRWGSAGLVVVNAFALRATKPSALYGHPDPVGPDNDEVITATLTDPLVDRVVAGWGTHAPLLGRDKQLPELVAALGVELLCLGVTQAGHPKHPLYLPNTTQLIPLEEARKC